MRLESAKELGSEEAEESGGSECAELRARALLSATELLHRLEEEVERSIRYQRPLALAVLELAEDGEELALRASAALRRVDRIGRGRSAERELWAVLPETRASVAAIPVQRMLDAVGAGRAGIACCPDDAASADALLEGARLALRRAPPGGVASLSVVEPLRVEELEVVAVDGVMTRPLELVRKLARGALPVLVTGETGAGKEVIARALHAWSPRSKGPLVAVSCASIPDSLLESELFGHAAGAFTGASGEKPGLLESASGGSILLDEIGECTPRAQAELLRVLETRRVRRLGALVERSIDVRLIAATNRDLAAEVEAGRFRRDLYYRLAAATVVVPPLRERPLDLPILARSFLAEVCRQRGLPERTLSPGALRRLQLHAWPGNVRELKNAIQFAAEISDGALIEARHLPESVGAEVAPWMLRELAGTEEGQRIPLYQEVRELEARRIREALAACEGVRVRTAERLGIPLRTLVTKIKEYGLQSYRRAERPAR